MYISDKIPSLYMSSKMTEDGLEKKIYKQKHHGAIYASLKLCWARNWLYATC